MNPGGNYDAREVGDGGMTMEKAAVITVLEQAEQVAREWGGAA